MSASASAAWTQPLRTELPPWLGAAAVARMGTLQALVAAALARAFAWHGQRERQRPERQCGQLLALGLDEQAKRSFLKVYIALGALAGEWRARSRPLDPINSGSTLLDAKQGGPMLRSLSLADAKGCVLAGPSPDNVARIHEPQQVALPEPGATDRLGPPIPDRGIGDAGAVALLVPLRLDPPPPARELKLQLRRANGGGHTLEVSVAPMQDDELSLAGFRGFGADASQQQLARSKPQAQLALTTQLLEVSPAPLFVMDSAGRFTMVNRVWPSLMALRQEQVIGHSSAGLVVEQADLHAGFDPQLLQSQECISFADWLLRHDSEQRDTAVAKVLFTGTDGRAAGIFGSLIGVTEVRQDRRATRKARDGSEQTKVAKPDFIPTSAASCASRSSRSSVSRSWAAARLKPGPSTKEHSTPSKLAASPCSGGSTDCSTCPTWTTASAVWCCTVAGCCRWLPR